MFRLHLGFASALWLVGCAVPATVSSQRRETQEPVRVEGDLFMNICLSDAKGLRCLPATMELALGGANSFTRTRILPEIALEVPAGALATGQLDLKGSTVDALNHRAFWHAGCVPAWFVTDLVSGVTTRFGLDALAIGVADSRTGQCLHEWVFDRLAGRAIVLGGRPTPTGHAAAEFALDITADGRATRRFDFTQGAAAGLRFMVPYQTVAAMNPERNEVTTLLFRPRTADTPAFMPRVAIDLATGQPTLSGDGGGMHHQFFVQSRHETIYFNCEEFTDGNNSVLRIPQADLDRFAITDLCDRSFVGAAYDPNSEIELMLYRKGTRGDPESSFVLGMADFGHGRWLGFVETDASYNRLRLASIVDENFYFNLEFAHRAVKR
jgi:hypothetical protein